MSETIEDVTTQPQISRADVTEAVRSTALLADLTISMWAAERTDAKVSNDVKVNAGAVGKSGRYIKNLLSGAEASYKAARAAYSAARAAHYTLTLPWVSNPTAERNVGPRLLPNLLFDRYLTEMSKLRNIAIQKRDEFVEEYPELIRQAQLNLGGMANATDYPTPEVVAEGFKLSFDFFPIPARDGFTGLPEDVLEKLGNNLARKQEAAVAASQGAMWERLHEAVGHLADRLADVDGKFKASTVETVREMIGLLPGFNCAGDPRVTTVVADITAMLDGVDAVSIRKDESTRNDVLRRARELDDKLSNWGV